MAREHFRPTSGSSTSWWIGLTREEMQEKLAAQFPTVSTVGHKAKRITAADVRRASLERLKPQPRHDYRQGRKKAPKPFMRVA